MKYFIYYQSDYSPSRSSNKGRPLTAITRRFVDTLLADENALTALVEELKRQVNALNERYPRAKAYSVEWSRQNCRIYIKIDKPAASAFGNEYVAILGYSVVKETVYASMVRPIATETIEEGGAK